MTSSDTKASTVVGKVISDKMQKTLVVLIERTVKHKKYGKMIRRNTKLHVHDEDLKAKQGDWVRVKESRPVSKTKNWTLVEVIS